MTRLICLVQMVIAGNAIDLELVLSTFVITSYCKKSLVVWMMLTRPQVIETMISKSQRTLMRPFSVCMIRDTPWNVDVVISLSQAVFTLV